MKIKNSLDLAFQSRRKNKQKALIAYVAAGYPPLKEEGRLLETLVNSGVDVLELGIPFSDPIADGPTIQYASHEALKNNISLAQILQWIKSIRHRIQCPIVLMGYFNPIFSYGIKKFAQEARAAGVQGLIVPDLIIEEGLEMEKLLHDQGIHLIYLVAQTTPRDRLRAIVKRTSGFLYAVSVAGVTGARKTFSPTIHPWLKHLKSLGSTPMCVGFGISSSSQIKELKKNADGFIVGSALIDVIRKNKGTSRIKAVEKFIQSLSKECHHAGS